jgi:hypothetical protein
VKRKEENAATLARGSALEVKEEEIYDSIIQVFCSFTQDLYSVALYAKSQLQAGEATQETEAMKSAVFNVDDVSSSSSSNPVIASKIEPEDTHREPASIKNLQLAASPTDHSTGVDTASAFDAAIGKATEKERGASAFDAALEHATFAGDGWRRRLGNMVRQMKDAMQRDAKDGSEGHRHLRDSDAVKQDAQKSATQKSTAEKVNLESGPAEDLMHLRSGHVEILNLDGAMAVLPQEETRFYHKGLGDRSESKNLTESFPYHQTLDVDFPSLYSSPEGLTQCYDDCHQSKGCELFAYSDVSTACMLVGKNGWYQLEQASAHLLGHSIEEDKIEAILHEAGYVGPSFEEGKDIPDWLVEVYKTFRLYMMHDQAYTMFDEKEHKYDCACLEHYEPDPGNWTRCLPPAAIIKEQTCTRIVVEGTLSIASGDDDVVNFDYSDSGDVTKSATSAGVFEECMMYLDCNDDQVFNQDELSCIVTGGECNIAEAPPELYTCNAVIDPLLQKGGYLCEIDQLGVGAVTVGFDIRPGGLPTEEGCAQRDPSPAEVALSLILQPSNGTEIFSPGPGEDPAAPFYETKGWCALCWAHSCQEIEAMEFNTNEFSAQQSSKIAWDINTYADTIGACLMCTADSADPTKCSFMQPTVQAEQWTVCDDMCAYFSCFGLEDEAAEQLNVLNFPVAAIAKLSNRIVIPLCYGCHADMRDPLGGQYLCRTKYDESYDYTTNPADKKLAKYFAKYPPGVDNSSTLSDYQNGKSTDGKKAEMMDMLNMLPQDQQDAIGKLSSADIIKVLTGSAEFQKQTLGFSMDHKLYSAAENVAARIVKEEAAGVNSNGMSMAELESLYGAGGTITVEVPGAAAVSAETSIAKQSSTVAGGEMVVATPADLIEKLPLPQQMYLASLGYAAKQKFIAADADVQMSEAGFEMDPVAKQQILAASFATVTRTAAVAAQNQAAAVTANAVEVEVERGDATKNKRKVSGWGLVGLLAGGGVLLALASVKFVGTVWGRREGRGAKTATGSRDARDPRRHVNIVLGGDLKDSDTMSLRPNDGVLANGKGLDLL